MSRIRYRLIFAFAFVVSVGLVACDRIPRTAPPTPPPTQPAPSTSVGWVEITFPQKDNVLPNPVIVEGFAGPGAQIVRIQIKDGSGTLLSEQVITFSEVTDAPRGFSVQIFYGALSQRIPGVIEAYFNEGSQPVNELPVILSPG